MQWLKKSYFSLKLLPDISFKALLKDSVCSLLQKNERVRYQIILSNWSFKDLGLSQNLQFNIFFLCHCVNHSILQNFANLWKSNQPWECCVFLAPYSKNKQAKTANPLQSFTIKTNPLQLKNTFMTSNMESTLSAGRALYELKMKGVYQ